MRINKTTFVLTGGYFEPPDGSSAQFKNNMLWFCDISAPLAPTWRFVDAPNGPSPRHSSLIEHRALTNELILFGGRVASGDYSDELFIFDLKTLTWRTSATTPRPLPRTYSSWKWADESHLFMFGGLISFDGHESDKNEDSDDMWVLNADTWAWTNLTNASVLLRPPASEGHRLAVTKSGDIYHTGGYICGKSDRQFCYNSQLWSLNTAALIASNFSATTPIKWVLNLPAPGSPADYSQLRSFHSATAVDNEVWVFGGSYVMDGTWYFRNDVSVYDPGEVF